MASISSTDSIGNTSLRGYGGMASGIDRDAIIEKMTLGTTTKINNQQSKITQLQWKQEAYRNISDQIIDFGDKYTSFSSTDSLIDPNFFAKSIISVHGRDEATRFVTATGSSDLISNISIKGVKQLATSTVRQSDAHISADGIKTNLDDLNADWRSSKLKGSQLIFEKKGEGLNGATEVIRLTLPDGYEENGKTKEIDYTTTDLKELARQLNKALESAEIKIGEETANKIFEFKVDADGKQLSLGFKDGAKVPQGYKVYGTAMTALGYDAANSGKAIELSELDKALRTGDFEQTGIHHTSALDAMTGAKLTFNYDGSQKEIELITAEEAAALKAGGAGGLTEDQSKKLAELQTQYSLTPEEAKELVEIWDNPQQENMDRFGELMDKSGISGVVDAGGDVSAAIADVKQYVELTEISQKSQSQLEQVASNIQKRLDRAFGTDMVKAEITSDGKLSFTTANKESSVSVVSNDYALLNNLGITYGESSKVNLNGKLEQAALLGEGGLTNDFIKDGTEDTLDLRINDVAIEGLTKNSSINDIISKINATSAAGVKATYVSATGQFMLVSTETGAGRDITLNSALAQKLFGATKDDGNGGKVYDEKAGVSKGQDAIISVSYGNGVDVDIKRASNTFNLEGLDVTVTGTFGGAYEKNEDGTDKLDADGKKIWKEDASQTVTFSAKADVDAIVERVKGFFEDFNKIATDVNNEITTRPDSSYGPLTDEQKKEMDDTSIENWEKKAKQGMLYGDSAMRDLSTDVQSVFLKLMNSMGKDGYEKLKQMGITYSDDYGDGGTISFDESKFRTAVEKDSEAVGNLFTGGGGVSKGLVAIMDETFTPYATRYASKNGGGKGSYGRLIEIAGSEKKPTSLLNNQIYNEIQNMQDQITRLREQLKTEQDRYISQFTTMESLLNQMNTQSSYLSQLTG